MLYTRVSNCSRALECRIYRCFRGFTGRQASTDFFTFSNVDHIIVSEVWGPVSSSDLMLKLLRLLQATFTWLKPIIWGWGSEEEQGPGRFYSSVWYRVSRRNHLSFMSKTRKEAKKKWSCENSSKKAEWLWTKMILPCLSTLLQALKELYDHAITISLVILKILASIWVEAYICFSLAVWELILIAKIYLLISFVREYNHS